MRLVFVSVLWILAQIGLAMGQNQNTSGTPRPSFLTIGALFTFNSTIGRSAQVAIKAAVDDVNADPSVLAGTTLNLTMQDTKCNGFFGTIEALQLIGKDVVSIIGPQSSGIAHVIAHVANELHVPLVSFAATDPTLSALQYPYFLRATQSDYFQMQAVADLIAFYRWKEVTTIFVDDDNGRNGISVLGDALAKYRAKIHYKATFPPSATESDLKDLLVSLNLMEPRVYIVHVNPDTGLRIFSIAKDLGMMSKGYAWIATDWLASVLDSTEPPDPHTMSLLQGVVVFRHYTPDSDPKTRFTLRWNDLLKKGNVSSSLNSYGLYAYDSVWLIARALNDFLNRGGNVSFSSDPSLHDAKGSSLHLSSLRTFNAGQDLFQRLLLTNFTGLSGRIQFDKEKYLVNPAYEILNIGGTGSRRLGYWSNYSSLSVVAPEVLYKKPRNTSTASQQLHTAIWPGETTTKPRGWVFPNNGKPLKIGVPNRVIYKEFVSKDNGPDGVKGFCIDIFHAAIALLPYAVPHQFVLYGNGVENPMYDGLVDMVAQNNYDAAVGDITIITNRTRIVDFTQPYIESGLVIVTPVKEISSNAWAFLKPFSLEMWIVTAVFFLFVGTVVWILEHRINTEFRGPPRQQLVTVFWFSFSTMFFSHRENTVSTLGRAVLIIWLFVVLIINSSYTASLTSILTVQQLSSGIEGIEGLITSTDQIGVQGGSFARNYLIQELNIAEHRLVSLEQRDDYALALERGPRGGGVSAIVDELPYIELFLSNNKCKFKIVGQEFTKSGWGFVRNVMEIHMKWIENPLACMPLSFARLYQIWAIHQEGLSINLPWTENQDVLLISPPNEQPGRTFFWTREGRWWGTLDGWRGSRKMNVFRVEDSNPHPMNIFSKTLPGKLAFQRDSPVAIDLSTAILTLSENGDLQRIHDKWLSRSGCTSQGSEDTYRLSLKSFWGLFLICGITAFLALFVFFMRVFCQFCKYSSSEDIEREDSNLSSQRSGRARSIRELLTFVDKKEAEVKSIMKRKSMELQQSAHFSDGQSSSPS